MNPIRTTRIMGTLIEIEEGMTEEGMIEEGIAIVIMIMTSLTGVELVAKERIHHPIHLIHLIQTMTMISMDADASARITTIDKTDVKTAIETDPQDNPHPSLIRAP